MGEILKPSNEEESLEHFQTEFLGPQVESEPGKNKFLEPVEKITEQELTEEESNLAFNFANEQRRVNAGYNHGKSFAEVEFYTDLPISLSETERSKFSTSTRIINGNVREVHRLTYGNAPEIDQGKDFNPQDTGEFKIAKPLNYAEGLMERFITENKPALEKILKENISDEKLTGVIVEQAIGYTEAGKTVPSELFASIPQEVQAKIKKQIKAAVSEMLPKPEKIDEQKLVELIKGKRVIIYTGAGISMASGVPGMDELKSGLGVNTSKEIDKFTQAAIDNPEGIIKQWEKFASAAAKAEPTKAHRAVAEIAESIGCQVLTTNVDTLHEQTGIKPIHTIAQWQKEGLRPEWLKDIDVVVVAGLAADAKGFLGWYKQNNPDGKIISLDLNQPSYLGNQDYFLQGDLQKSLPELAKKIKDNKK